MRLPCGLHRQARPRALAARESLAAALLPPILDASSADNEHAMVTRGKSGIRRPIDRLNLHAAPLSPVPRTYRAALADPHWRTAMEEEYNALLANRTWDLVPRPPVVNVVTGKWIFRHKFQADGSLDRYKARWVLHGFTQRPGIDFDETFSPVVKPATVRTVLSLAVSKDWPIHQLDVKNAFLHGTLQETVYCSQPAGFIDPTKPDMICRLNKSLYGLKQAPRAWYSRFASFLLTLGFSEARSDTSLFIYHRGSDVVYLLLYVDDIVLTASSDSLLRWTISALQAEFSMKDLGPLHHFLGIRLPAHPLVCSSASDSTFLMFLLVLACPSASHVLRRSTLMPSSQLSMVPQLLTRLITGASLVHYNISLSPGQIYPMLSSKSAFTCMTPGSRTLPLSSVYFATLRAPSIMDCIFSALELLTWLLILMLIGPVVPTRGSPPRAMPCFLVPT